MESVIIGEKTETVEDNNAGGGEIIATESQEDQDNTTNIQKFENFITAISDMDNFTMYAVVGGIIISGYAYFKNFDIINSTYNNYLSSSDSGNLSIKSSHSKRAKYTEGSVSSSVQNKRSNTAKQYPVNPYDNISIHC